MTYPARFGRVRPADPRIDPRIASAGRGNTTNKALVDLLRIYGGFLPGVGIGVTAYNIDRLLNGSSGGSARLGKGPRLNRMRGGVAERGGFKQPVDPLGGLYEDLIAMLTEGGGVSPIDVDPVYDARVAAIREMMGQQEHRTQRNRQDVENMYRSLANDYERLAPQQRAQAREGQEDVEQLYGELATNIEGTYSRIQEEQADMFEQLGIEAAAPDIMEEQGEAEAAAIADAEQLGAINEQRYMDIGNIDQTYYREGAPLAVMAGSNKSADLLQQLQDYLGAREQDILGVEAERSVAAQEAMMAAQQANQSQQQQQAQMLWQIMQAQMEAQQAPTEINSSQFLSSLPPQIAGSVSGAFRQLERNPNIVLGRTEDPRHPVPGTFVPTTDEYWLNEVDAMYERGEIDDATRQYLMQFLRLYLGER